MPRRKLLALAAVLAIMITAITAIASSPAFAAETIELVTDWWRGKL